jgi:DNA-binding response OmpR family regulator
MNNYDNGFVMNIKLPDAHKDSMESLATIALNAVQSALPKAKIKFSPLATPNPEESVARRSQAVAWHHEKGILIVDGVEERLNRMEQVILTRLALTPNEYASYPELLALLQAQAKDVGTASNLRVLVHRLRKKVGDGIIHTDKQYGYSLRTADGRLRIL